MLVGPPEDQAWDCPECGVKASVRADFCEVCYAELDEFRLDPMDPAADLAEALPERFTPTDR
jgi:hypothetical protein